MSRLDFKTKSRAQKTVDGLYMDLERRIIASPPGQCPVDMAESFLSLCHAQSCGKCVPCRLGIAQMLKILTEILDLNSNIGLDKLELLERTAKTVSTAADCAIGKEAGRMVLKGLSGFRDDFEEHIKNHRCVPYIADDRQPVPCVADCPAGVDVPGYSALVRAGRYDDAVKLIRKDNPFPTVCAHICEHPCEHRCRRQLIDSPVNIRGLKKYAVDNCSEVVPIPAKADDTGKTVAIIGGGPSGLTAAYFLALMGHKPTIYEKRGHLGGMLRYGIPNYRLPRERLDWDIDSILSAGVEVVLEYDPEKHGTMEEIMAKNDATYISIGAHTHKAIRIDGEYLHGVVPAVEMLRGIGDNAMPDFEGKSVAVIGGGNVAMDVARTAKRLGASEVNIVYRRRRDDMTALPEEIDGAIAEGCNLMELKAPVRIEGDEDDNVKALIVQPQIAGAADSSGRPKPVAANSPEEVIPCQIIISAIGQGIDYSDFKNTGIPIDERRGLFVANKANETIDNPGVYAGGDCVTGPSTVINAIAAGKVAAANIDEYLGFNHEISVDVEVPLPAIEDKKPCGRAELRLRYAHERGNDFYGIEQGMSLEEALQEAGRCLRCDYNGFGYFRGGRVLKW
ncbi:MAG: FAD-dependent oxidoreductase [Eubacterium sp.]|nr:FAD-dependent oxidoreductase [Candidatus Colimonas fimequi]